MSPLPILQEQPTKRAEAPINLSLMDSAPLFHTWVLGSWSRPGHHYVPSQLSGMPALNSQFFFLS